MLTGYGKPGHLRRALAAQVDGFLLKTAPPEDLVAAIRKVTRGERVLDPSLAVTAWDLADNPLTARGRRCCVSRPRVRTRPRSRPGCT